MHSQEPFMFYKTYPLDSYLEDIKRMEKEQELMFSYLPEEYRRMQRKVEEACDRMEYEGSRMYDERPDGNAIRQMSRRILEQLQAESDGMSEDTKEKDSRYQEDMVCCFLCNEMFRRRYRSWYGKRYIK